MGVDVSEPIYFDHLGLDVPDGAWIQLTCKGEGVSWYRITRRDGRTYEASIPDGWSFGGIRLPIDWGPPQKLIINGEAVN